ncbi:MAG: putative nucleotide-diphospho-sugar transferase [Saprospiraceae bacterium]
MNGYLYIAFGEKYLNEAVVSVESLLKVDPKANFTLITNSYDLVPSIFKNVILLSIDTDKPFLYKIKALSLSPYERTFFIDTDTYFCDTCIELFSLLDYFDILIAHCNNDYLDVYNKLGEAILGYYSYNTGVIIYKKRDKTIEFLKDWYNAYYKHFNLYVHDQPPFMECLLDSDIKIYVLQSIYNARTPYPLSLIARPVKIIHGRHNDYIRIAQKLNKSANCSRVWFPRFKLVLAYRRTKFFKWYMSLNPAIKIKVKNIVKPIVMKLGMRDYI